MMVDFILSLKLLLLMMSRQKLNRELRSSENTVITAVILVMIIVIAALGIRGGLVIGAFDTNNLLILNINFRLYRHDL